jgi:hypothetical protein
MAGLLMSLSLDIELQTAVALVSCTRPAFAAQQYAAACLANACRMCWIHVNAICAYSDVVGF